MGSDLFKAGGITVAIDKFINKIVYLLLPFRQHGHKVFENNSKVNLEVSDTCRRKTPRRCRTLRGCFCLLGVGHLLILGCGSGNGATDVNSSVATQTIPIVTRVSPASGSSGSTATIFGFGFSAQPGANIVSVGATSTTASTYALVNPPAAGEIESLTFTVPSGATTGANSVFVTVFENTSNTNVQFTVNP